MATYWLTFRIEDENVGGKDWDARYRALTDAVDKNSSSWWVEPTSFIVFESSNSIDTLAGKFKAAIAPSKDLFLIRALDTKSARICGANSDHAIYQFMPYLKSA